MAKTITINPTINWNMMARFFQECHDELEDEIQYAYNVLDGIEELDERKQERLLTKYIQLLAEKKREYEKLIKDCESGE